MQELKYSDKLLPGSRTPRLFVVSMDGLTVHEFKGKSIPGMLVVLKENYEKNGKWSGTDFVLSHNPEKTSVLPLVRALHASSVFEDKSSLAAMRKQAKWPEGASDASFEAFIQRHYPVIWEKFQTIQGLITSL